MGLEVIEKVLDMEGRHVRLGGMMGKSQSERLRLEGFGTRLEPRCVGIYALINKGEVVYVGQSRNLWTRLGQHFQTRRRGRGRGSTKLGAKWADTVQFEFDEILIKYCFLEERDRIELEVIERYRPRFNIQIRPVMPAGIKLSLADIAAMWALTRPKPGTRMERRRL